MLGKVNFAGEDKPYLVKTEDGPASADFVVRNGQLVIVAVDGLDAGKYDLTLVQPASEQSIHVTIDVNDIVVPSLSVSFEGGTDTQTATIDLPKDTDGDSLSLSDFDQVKTDLGEYSLTDGVLSFSAFHEVEESTSDTLSVTVTDGRGGTTTASLTVSIEVADPRVFNLITGTTAGEDIYGTRADDWINAGAGNDYIYSHDGDDVIRGEAGNDWIQSGFGNDIMIGGEGSDRFYAEKPPFTGTDFVLDFNPDEGDRIGIDVSDIFRASSIQALQTETDLRWTNDSDAGRKNSSQIAEKNDKAVNDTIIYSTQGTADLSDDIMVMVIEDFTTELNFTMLHLF